MPKFGIEQLKDQGLDHFSAIYGNKANTVFLYLHTKKRFGRNEYKHVKDYAQRFLCPSCPLKTNDGPIKCSGVGNSNSNAEAHIESTTIQPEVYWQALLTRIACQPVDEWNGKRS